MTGRGPLSSSLTACALTVSAVKPRLASEALIGALGAVPADDWRTNWAAGSTFEEDLEERQERSR